MKKSLLTILTVLSAFLISHTAYSADMCDHTCSKCHQVAKDDVQNALKANFPDVKVVETRPAQVKGLYEVIVESKGQKGIIYVDLLKKYLVSGTVIDVQTKANLTQERFAEINKVDVAQIPLDDAIVMGDKDAPKKVIVFTDPD